jgi:3-deoxy-D-manno-octulosonate 8-phosphate phosphatase (KDO 8-P phosphatase)
MTTEPSLNVESIRLLLSDVDGILKDKIASANEILERLGLSFENVGYIGDDLTDLALLKRCGFSATVADGVPEVKQAVDYVTKASGGMGAIRELVELILKRQGRWEQTIESYTG